MKIVVKLFAGARELAGQSEIELELPAGATIGQLRDVLLETRPQLQPLLSHALFAVDAEYAKDHTPVPADADIACIPPVSGG